MDSKLKEAQMKVGSLIIQNCTKGGWFSTLQRFFTRMPYTHVAGFIGDVNGIPSVLEAKQSIATTPWHVTTDDPTIEFYIFEPTDKIDRLVIESAVIRVYDYFAGRSYAYLQLLFFLYRWLMEGWPFYKDVRKQHNPFVNGDICSEVWYAFLQDLSTVYPDIAPVLNEYTRNTVNAGDMYNILIRLPQYYKLTTIYQVPHK